MDTQTGLLNKLKEQKLIRHLKIQVVLIPQKPPRKPSSRSPTVLGFWRELKRPIDSLTLPQELSQSNKLRGQLVHVKDKRPKDKQSNLVYGYKCAEPGCSESYIGETKQSLKARIGQHRRPSSSDCQPDSAVYAHARSTGLQIDPEEVIVLDPKERWFWTWSTGGNLGADRTTFPQQTRGTQISTF